MANKKGHLGTLCRGGGPAPTRHSWGARFGAEPDRYWVIGAASFFSRQTAASRRGIPVRGQLPGKTGAVGTEPKSHEKSVYAPKNPALDIDEGRGNGKKSRGGKISMVMVRRDRGPARHGLVEFFQTGRTHRKDRASGGRENAV